GGTTSFRWCSAIQWRRSCRTSAACGRSWMRRRGRRCSSIYRTSGPAALGKRARPSACRSGSGPSAGSRWRRSASARATTTSRREELGSGKARTVFELTLADYGTLVPRVPDLLLAVSGPDGSRQLQVRGRPLKFRSLVREEGETSPERAHHGPKPPVPVMVRSFLWVWLLGGLALAVALLVLRRRLAGLWRRPERDTPAEPFFDDLALERLRELRTEAPWTRGRGRAAIFAL